MLRHTYARSIFVGASALVFLWYSYLFFGSFIIRTFTNIDQEVSGSNFVNQFILLFTICFSIILFFWSRENIIRLLKSIIPIIAVYLWFLATVFWSLQPAITVRRVAGEAIFLFFVICVVPVIKSPKNAVFPLILALLLVLFANIISIVMFPGESFDELGNFHGTFIQKNSASTAFFIIALLTFFYGLSRDKSYERILFSFISIISLIFLAISGSKTVIGFSLILSSAFSLIYFLSRLERFSFLLLVLAFLAIFGFSWMFIVFGDISQAEIYEFFTGDPTLTRRTELWEYLVLMIEERPILGVGWGAIWNIGTDLNPLPAPHNIWFMDASDINTAHNTFIDVWAQGGAVGLIIVVFFIFRTIWVYYTIITGGNMNRSDATIVFGLLIMGVFIILNSFTETYLFQPSGGIGRLFVYLAIFGEYWRMVLGSRHLPAPGRVIRREAVTLSLPRQGVRGPRSASASRG